MPVAQYTPSKTPTLHAVLWQGREEDLAEMPGLDQSDVSFWVEDGLLYIHNLDEPDQVARPDQYYVVRGVTGYYFTVEKEAFEREYVPLEVLERRPVWTPEQARNVLGEPVDFPRRDQGMAWVEYDRAANLCERIIGHYETRLDLAALALEQSKPNAKEDGTRWLTQFSPDWGANPWANYATLQYYTAGNGPVFCWYYWECEPRWGERNYNHVQGKWGHGNDLRTQSLFELIDLRTALQQRPEST